MGSSSHKYLCQFRGRCPAFNRTDITCLEKPWTCSNWVTHLENQKKGKKPILDAKDFSLINMMGESKESVKIDPLETQRLRERLTKELQSPSIIASPKTTTTPSNRHLKKRERTRRSK